MSGRVTFFALLLSALLCGGCKSSMRSDSADSVLVAHDQGYALLYSTISDESDLGKILIIKHPNAQVKEVVKAIAQFAKDAKGALEALAKEPPTIDLDHQGLPETETKTREAISSATSKQIIFNSGKELEFRLLLTQHEALNYITSLAQTLAEQEPSESRKVYLEQLAKESDALHERVLVLLKTPYVGPAK